MKMEFWPGLRWNLNLLRREFQVVKRLKSACAHLNFFSFLCFYWVHKFENISFLESTTRKSSWYVNRRGLANPVCGSFKNAEDM
jgi:hypothetical protein